MQDCNNLKYDNELNERLNTRYFPSEVLKPVFDSRPVSTKYSHFQLFEEQKATTVPLMNYKTYSPHEVFTPGDGKAPAEYFFTNVDVESKLRNQFMALQKCDRAEYVPEVNSTLYTSDKYIPIYSLQKETPVSDIHFNPDRCNLAPNLFFNHTRINLKNM